jgi:hypothetical protein
MQDEDGLARQTEVVRATRRIGPAEQAEYSYLLRLDVDLASIVCFHMGVREITVPICKTAKPFLPPKCRHFPPLFGITKTNHV